MTKLKATDVLAPTEPTRRPAGLSSGLATGALSLALTADAVLAWAGIALAVAHSPSVLQETARDGASLAVITWAKLACVVAIALTSCSVFAAFRRRVRLPSLRAGAAIGLALFGLAASSNTAATDCGAPTCARVDRLGNELAPARPDRCGRFVSCVQLVDAPATVAPSSRPATL